MDTYIEKAIAEVSAAQYSDFPIAALSLALTLPDICSQAEAKAHRASRKLYIRWCNKWMPPESSCDMDGLEFYALRCSVLHDGDDDICDSEVLRGSNDETDLFFKLKVPKNKDNIGVSLFFDDPKSDMDKHKIIQVDSRAICRKILDACKSFIKANPDIKFNSNILLE